MKSQKEFFLMISIMILMTLSQRLFQQKAYHQRYYHFSILSTITGIIYSVCKLLAKHEVKMARYWPRSFLRVCGHKHIKYNLRLISIYLE